METLNTMSIDSAVELVINELKENSEKHYLHKPQEFRTPDSKLDFCINEDDFIASDDHRFNTIARLFLNNKCLCYGMHNGRVVFKIKDYFVAASPAGWTDKFHIVKRTAKGGETKNDLNAVQKDKMTKTIAAYGSYVSETIKLTLKEDSDKYGATYFFFNSVECSDIENNKIYSKIKHFYNDVLEAVDLRTNTPLAESFFTMIGWLFSPQDKSLRMAGCFECSTSGIGKTQFIQYLCKRTEVVHATMSQSSGRSNQFSFSPCFVNGPDIITVDDPCKGTNDILHEMSNVVSNNKATVELKSKDRYYLDDVVTRFYISTNVPLYMHNDNNNFLTKKIFVLKAKEIGDIPDKESITSSIIKYISYCDEKEVYEFLSYCVSLYQTNGKQFIADHLGLYIDSETVSNLFADAFYTQDIEGYTNKKTLIECVNGNMQRAENHREFNDEILKNWNKITKFIKDTYPDIAAKTVCSVPSDNAVYAPGNRPSKSRYKNYTLTDELRAIVLNLIKDGT